MLREISFLTFSLWVERNQPEVRRIKFFNFFFDFTYKINYNFATNDPIDLKFVSFNPESKIIQETIPYLKNFYYKIWFSERTLLIRHFRLKRLFRIHTTHIKELILKILVDYEFSRYQTLNSLGLLWYWLVFQYFTKKLVNFW